MHACDNPPCFNPDHLVIGTQKDNMAAAAAKGRMGGRKLNPAQVRAIKYKLSTGESRRAPAIGKSGASLEFDPAAHHASAQTPGSPGHDSSLVDRRKEDEAVSVGVSKVRREFDASRDDSLGDHR